MNHIALSLLTLAALTPFRLAAADGRIPIGAAAVYPVTLTAPGHYYLTADLTGAAASNGLIFINADDVSLDLNGHAVSNTSVTSPRGILINSGRSRITLRNGRIIGGVSAIEYTAGVAAAAGDFSFEDLFIQSASFIGSGINITSAGTLFRGVVIRNCQVNFNGNAIYLNGVNGALIEKSLLRGANPNVSVNILNSTGVLMDGNTLIGGSSGVQILNGAGALQGHRFTNNLISAPSANGAVINNCRGCLVKGNTFAGTLAASSSGISMSGGSNNTIADNNVVNFATGLSLGGVTGSIYSGNRLAGNTAPLTAGTNQSGGGNCDGTTCS